tara:strand:- start:9 stop:452 length:444 start_codon:yes stop_codon:yes gene_type:complete
MAHYAELGVDNVVKRVLFIETKDCMTNGGIEKEEIGRAHLEEHHGGTWMKCSYNTKAGQHSNSGTPFRANYPGVGYKYNSTNDIFYPPCPNDKDGEPSASWTVNSTTGVWEPPVTKPTASGKEYIWDESAYKADNTKGWVEVDSTGT